MNKVLLSIFGTSWKTSAAGYGTAAAVAVMDFVQSQGDLSHLNTSALVVAVGAALLGRFAKDHNVSNSPAAQLPAEEVKK